MKNNEIKNINYRKNDPLGSYTGDYDDDLPIQDKNSIDIHYKKQ